jgi:hypothetical protein
MWMLLLALVVFILYWLRPAPTPPPGCNACAKRPIVSPIE